MRHDRKVVFSLLTGCLVGVIILGIGFSGGYFVATRKSAEEGSISGVPPGVDLSPVWDAWNIISQNYVPVVVASSSPISTSTAQENQDEVWGLVSGLVGALNDPYSYFLPPSENQAFSQDMSGSFDGVGMEVETENQVLTVISPLVGTPAAKAGIEAGDQILDIDGTSTADMDSDTAVDLIRGPAGTQVTLTVLRKGWSAPQNFIITREAINVPEVTAQSRSDGIFVIEVAEFTSNSPDLFRDALRQFVESGDTKLILDLRGNPGGYLDAAVDLASWFLPSGDTVVTEDYDGHQANIVNRSLGYNIFSGTNLKMVVLVDGGSASAAEILADALHYYGVATLIGTNTYGKGSVQELFPITADTSLKLTVARWLGPDGQPIPTTGIVPDKEVDITAADQAAGIDSQMNAAVEYLGGDASSTQPQAQPVQ